MEIKGTAVKSINDFVQLKFRERYTEWINILPKASKDIMLNPIYSTNWYPLEEGGVIPTEKLGLLFYGNANKGAWESGRFSAEMALTGVYKVFIKLTTPAYIIDRASKIFSTYYQPGDFSVTGRGSHYVLMELRNFTHLPTIVEQRICGWVQKALEINNCTNVLPIVTKAISDGEEFTEIKVTWEN